MKNEKSEKMQTVAKTSVNSLSNFFKFEIRHKYIKNIKEFKDDTNFEKIFPNPPKVSTVFISSKLY